MEPIFNALLLVILSAVAFLFLAIAIWHIAKLISKHHHHRSNNLGKVKPGRIIVGLIDFVVAINIAFWLMLAVIALLPLDNAFVI